MRKGSMQVPVARETQLQEGVGSHVEVCFLREGRVLCCDGEPKVRGLWVGSHFWRIREKRANLSSGVRSPACSAFCSSTSLHGCGVSPGSLSTQEPGRSSPGGQRTAGQEKWGFEQKNDYVVEVMSVKAATLGRRSYEFIWKLVIKRSKDQEADSSGSDRKRWCGSNWKAERLWSERSIAKQFHKWSRSRWLGAVTICMGGVDVNLYADETGSQRSEARMVDKSSHPCWSHPEVGPELGKRELWTWDAEGSRMKAPHPGVCRASGVTFPPEMRKNHPRSEIPWEERVSFSLSGRRQCLAQSLAHSKV